jgi:hypothetical protein
MLGGVALAAISLASAGALLLRGSNDFEPVQYVASHKALKIALVEPPFQAQIERPTALAANIPALEINEQRPIIASIEPVPLPHAKPRQRVAAVPLPRARVALDVPASAPEPVAEKASEPAPAIIADATLAPEPAAEQPPEHAPAIVTASLDPPATEPAPANTPPAPPLPPARTIALMSFAPSRELLFDKEITGSIGNAGRDASSPRDDTHKTPPETTRAVVAPPRLAAIAPTRPLQEKTAPAKPSRPLSIREKLWGSAVRLASLTPMDNSRDNDGGIPRAPYDRQTAVYVIGDKKVYLPDGTMLEAHSGLGPHMDDPRFVHVRMRGATPPHVYDLTMRESLFHGVEAIRMTPIRGESAIFGRDGILAHTYMLGPNGQSNGCVSFKDYDAFLDAFKAGKINRLAVVGRLD